MHGSHHLFLVTYMDWTAFKTTVMSNDENNIRTFLGYECIVGGVDYTIDFR